MRITARLSKQHNIGRSWGYFLHIIGQMGMVTQLVNLCLLIVTTATVLQTRGVMVSIWLLGFLVALTLLSAGVVIFKVGLPSYFSAWNQQWYSHDNPLRKDIEQLKIEVSQLHEIINNK